MAIKHIPDGQDFSSEHFPADFGFTGSAHGDGVPYASNRPTRDPSRQSPSNTSREGASGNNYAKGGEVPFASDSPTRDGSRQSPSNLSRPGESGNEYAEGGHTEHHHDGRVTHHHGDGTMSVHHTDGRVVHHHADGGHTVHHPGGMIAEHHAHGGHTEMHPGGMRVEHHADGGRTIHHPDGSADHHDSSEYVHRAQGGDVAQDKAMVTKGIRQHENHEHGGEHTDLHLRGGGALGTRTTIPKGMRPAAGRRHTPIGDSVKPLNPQRTVTPRNAMPGGQMPYGVEPSAEPDVAGSDQTGVSQMHKGGRMR